jgi:outer membrane protein assembly factor BamB
MPSNRLLIVALNGMLAAIDTRSGERVWTAKLDSGQGEVAIAITERRIFASAQGAEVVCVRYDTGLELWRAPTTEGGRATLLLDGDCLYVSKAGYLDRLSVTEGLSLWSQPLKGFGTGEASLGLPGNVVQADSLGPS